MPHDEERSGIHPCVTEGGDHGRGRESNEPYGVDWSTPVARFEEALATIRALWASGGELVTRDSPFFPLRNAVFGLPPYRGKWPEIWIGSHGPRMLRITGRQADGWLPAAIARPTHYATCLETVRSAASDAGRDPGSIIPACFRFVITGRSREEVDEVLDSPSVKAFALHLPATEWARHGARHPLGDDFAGYADLAPQTIDEQTALSYLSDVPPSLLEEGVFAGTPAEVIDQAAQWRDHGLRYAVVCNASALQPSLRRGLAASGTATATGTDDVTMTGPGATPTGSTSSTDVVPSGPATGADTRRAGGSDADPATSAAAGPARPAPRAPTHVLVLTEVDPATATIGPAEDVATGPLTPGPLARLA